jgi:hypothetical protein
MKQPNPAHERMWASLKQALITATTDDGLSERESLAVVGKFVGMMLAIQDQRRGRDVIMAEFIENVELGNKEFIDMIFKDAKS